MGSEANSSWDRRLKPDLTRRNAATERDGYTIRPATQADLPAILRMRGELFEHLKRSNQRILLPSREALSSYVQRCREKLAWDGCLWLVAADTADRVIGMGEIHEVSNPDLVPETTAKINDVWVDVEHRHRGVATAIARGLLAFARRRGLGHVWLDWVAGNREAEGFWRRLGFAPTVVMAVRRNGAADDGAGAPAAPDERDGRAKGARAGTVSARWVKGRKGHES